MTHLEAILSLWLQVACVWVNVWACRQVLSCKHMHPAVRNTVAVLIVTRNMMTTDMWMSHLVNIVLLQLVCLR